MSGQKTRTTYRGKALLELRAEVVEVEGRDVATNAVRQLDPLDGADQVLREVPLDIAHGLIDRVRVVAVMFRQDVQHLTMERREQGQGPVIAAHIASSGEP